jgi:hypothetical protein
METRASDGAPDEHPLSEPRKLERLSEHLRVLADASHEFTGLTPNLNELLRAVTRRLVGTVCDGCAVLLVTTDRLWLDPVAVDARWCFSRGARSRRGREPSSTRSRTRVSTSRSTPECSSRWLSERVK